MQNGKAVLNLCKELRLTVMNYAMEMPGGDYTTYTGNAAIRSSTVDYACVSEDAAKSITRVRLTTGRKPMCDIDRPQGGGSMTRQKECLFQKASQRRKDPLKKSMIGWCSSLRAGR